MRQHNVLYTLVFIALLLLLHSTTARAERRTALVIGNAAYESGLLRNPVNDATDMAATLQHLGFEVTLLRDAKQGAMYEAIEAFSINLRHKGGVGLFYFAGYGIQVAGQNYLIPVGAQIGRERDVPHEAVPVERILGRMGDADNGLNILILDACRDNPFARQRRSSRERGLAMMQETRGALIAYATAPGETCADGSGRNGVYTLELLRYMATPGLSMEEVFKRVRLSVMDATKGQQIPWETSFLSGDFYFVSPDDSKAARSSPPSQSLSRYTVVRVFYATDRNRNNTSTIDRLFGTKRGELSYGTCEVSIPSTHRMGELESPSIRRFEFSENPTQHIVLLAVTLMQESQYFAELATRIRSSADNKAFIFIHGYNVSFQDAARRTAQILYDLNFDGAAIFYSWPSQGTFEGYPIDETNIEWTQAHLRRFLEDFVTRTMAQNIYLIAHSMGNRALVRAFSALLADKPTLRQHFREVILTAPDIDAEVFKRDIAPQIVSNPPFVTLYASSEDKALLASKKFHGYPRAGDAGDRLVLVSGIDTIDATGVDTSFVKHSYFAEARSILGDLFSLVRDGKRPDYRFGLERVDTVAGRYWKFKR
jgi:esterase/lipase superfamily enzyme